MDNPASRIDHTLLKPDCTRAQILTLCEEAVEFGFAAVCIPPSYVRLAGEHLYGTEVLVATVVGFPLGYVSSEIKALETRYAIAHGAREIDMVIHLGAARQGDFPTVEDDIRQVVAAAEGTPVKAIIECCYFDRATKEALVGCVRRAQAAYVKTSTGFGPGGATQEDASLLVACAGGDLKVKAAGGIRDWATCKRYLAAGVSRIGTSNGVAIVDQWRQEAGL